jgi:hypothetical protein
MLLAIDTRARRDIDGMVAKGVGNGESPVPSRASNLARPLSLVGGTTPGRVPVRL